MSRKYKKYTKEQFIDAVASSFSYSEVCRKIDIRPVGGNLNTIRTRIHREELDCSHFTGQLWSKDKQLKDWNKYARTASLKKILINERGYACECCAISTWLGQPLILELDHVDGDRTNNDKLNLKLLCPNCHS